MSTLRGLSNLLYRRSFFGKESISLMLILPIALPGIITGIALLSAFKALGICLLYTSPSPRD